MSKPSRRPWQRRCWNAEISPDFYAYADPGGLLFCRLRKGHLGDHAGSRRHHGRAEHFTWPDQQPWYDARGIQRPGA